MQFFLTSYYQIQTYIMVSSKIWSSTTANNNRNIVIKNKFWPQQHIRMISEASCDPEDWSNGWQIQF